MLRSRQRSQSIVEFGIIAILFTLIMFAIADFGLLLNDWLSVSSGARQLARDAAVGMTPDDIKTEAWALQIPGVTADSPLSKYCCDVASGGSAGSALQVDIQYFNQCTPGATNTPGQSTCVELTSGELDYRYTPIGGCSGPSCHPWAPTAKGNCPTGGDPNQLCPGDTVRVTLTAAGAQVITPLVRPFFSNSTTCQPNSAHCFVPVSSSVTMRFEGGATP